MHNDFPVQGGRVTTSSLAYGYAIGVARATLSPIKWHQQRLLFKNYPGPFFAVAIGLFSFSRNPPLSNVIFY